MMYLKLDYTPEEESYAILKILLEKELSRLNSHSRWVVLNKGRTDKEILLSEIALKRYNDACIALGYNPQEHMRISEALNRGQLPPDVIAAALYYKSDCFSGDDLLAIDKGYSDEDLLKDAKYISSEKLPPA